MGSPVSFGFALILILLAGLRSMRSSHCSLAPPPRPEGRTR